MSTSTSSHYSSESQTTEIYEESRVAKRVLKYSIVIQTVLAATVVIFGVYSLTQCQSTHFAGLTTVLGLIVFLLHLTTGYCTFSRYRAYSLVTAVLGLVATILLCLDEVGNFFCTQENASSTMFCQSFRKNADPCQWSKKRKVTTTMMTLTTGQLNGETKTLWVRTVVLILSFLSLIFCVITLVILGVAIKVGKLVYLNRKRHKRSIVVGRSKNVFLADTNKRRNLNLTKPSYTELKRYEEPKQNITTECSASLGTTT